ncbi:MAG: hypothetical protein QOE70_945 [Chthoniobacter sp.]|jgi:hypothetical protein|nr:hypothetical protein [Chthoniobacter sp.]
MKSLTSPIMPDKNAVTADTPPGADANTSEAPTNTPPAADAAKSSVPPEKTGGKKSKLSKTLPTDRINIPKQFEIIVAYSSAFDKAGQQPISNQDVASLVGLAPATVAMMNAFLMDVGIVQKTDGGKFLPSAEARECARMFQINPGRAWLKLASLMERSWFGEELTAKLRVRTFSETEAIEDLAEVAHAEKDHLPQLKVALDYMEKSGVLLREGGQLRLVSQSQRTTNDQTEGNGSGKTKKTSPDLEEEEDSELERHSLTLDPLRKRRIVILTPPTITKRELERIQQWLSFQLIVSDEVNPTQIS